ncbi:hypothetical protein AB4254_11340 [Vibrio breoganii]
MQSVNHRTKKGLSVLIVPLLTSCFAIKAHAFVGVDYENIALEIKNNYEEFNAWASTMDVSFLVSEAKSSMSSTEGSVNVFLEQIGVSKRMELTEELYNLEFMKESEPFEDICVPLALQSNAPNSDDTCAIKNTVKTSADERLAIAQSAFVDRTKVDVEATERTLDNLAIKSQYMVDAVGELTNEHPILTSEGDLQERITLLNQTHTTPLDASLIMSSSLHLQLEDEELKSAQTMIKFVAPPELDQIDISPNNQPTTQVRDVMLRQLSESKFQNVLGQRVAPDDGISRLMEITLQSEHLIGGQTIPVDDALMSKIMNDTEKYNVHVLQRVRALNIAQAIHLSLQEYKEALRDETTQAILLQSAIDAHYN